MNDRDKNVVDKFLEGYEYYSNNQVKYRKVLIKPSKGKAIVGFAFSVLLLVLLLFMFVFNILYFVLLLGVLLSCLYYGLNLFTEKGFGLPKRVPVTEDETTDKNSVL